MKNLLLALFILTSSVLKGQTNWFTIPVDIYETNVIVLITKNSEEAVSFTRYFTKDSSITFSDFDTTRYEGRTFYGTSAVVWIPSIPLSAHSFSVLIHELFHVTHLILDYVEIELSNESSEAYAYLLGFLTKNTFLHLNKYYVKQQN